MVNEGNRDETDVTVSLLLQNQGGLALEDRSEGLADTGSGCQRNRRVCGLAVPAGEKLTATITVGMVDGETDTDNNRREVPFFVNEPA